MPRYRLVWSIAHSPSKLALCSFDLTKRLDIFVILFDLSDDRHPQRRRAGGLSGVAQHAATRQTRGRSASYFLSNRPKYAVVLAF